MYGGQQQYYGGGHPGVMNPSYAPDTAGYPPMYNSGVPAQAGYYPPPQGYAAGPPPAPVVPRAAPPTNQGGRRTGRTSPEDGWEGAGDSFSDKNIRAAFVRKVYLILTAQLLVTLAFICVFVFVKSVKRWVQDNMWFYICAYVVFFVLYFVLVCVKKARRTSPANYICLSIFTIAFSIVAGTISSYHDTDIVLIMMGVTAGVTILVSLFAWQTKIDFTKGYCLMIAFFLSIALFVFGLAVLITWQVTNNETAKILQAVYGGVGALIFCFFLAIDTQMLLGNKSNSLSEEEYIYAALQIYVDVVYIFLMLLSLGGGASD